MEEVWVDVVARKEKCRGKSDGDRQRETLKDLLITLRVNSLHLLVNICIYRIRL